MCSGSVRTFRARLSALVLAHREIRESEKLENSSLSL
ncbi:unnamed protein product [Arabidopsis halleri]